jgi:hypothetical protein
MKQYFYLRNIDVYGINTKYDINVHTFGEKTFIDELKIQTNEDENTTPSYLFMDVLKNKHKCITLPTNGEKKINTLSCYWCRHHFNHHYIECPVDVSTVKKEKSYYSFVNKNSYTIHEPITGEHVPNEIYITDGYFCSFNCCLAFIHDNQHNVYYKKSLVLLNQYYYKLYNVKMNVIPAPHWRLLKDYGGYMTIEEFRTCFKNISFNVYGFTTDITSRSKFILEKVINF